MNGNKYENIKLSIDSSNSYLRALKFLSNFSSKRRTKNKKNKRTNKTKTFKKSLSLTSIDYVSYHKCLMPCQRQFHDHESSVFRVFLPVFNLALGLFREEQCSVANFDEPRQKRGSHQICPMPIFFWQKNVFPCNNYFDFIILSSSFRLRLGKIFKFFGFFKNFFLYLLFHQMKQFCFANLLGIPQ